MYVGAGFEMSLTLELDLVENIHSYYYQNTHYCSKTGSKYGNQYTYVLLFHSIIKNLFV